jgi:hypothetical protein
MSCVNPREVFLGGVVDLLRQGGKDGATGGQHGNRSSDKSRCPHGSPLEAAPERRAAPDRRTLHDDEAGALQMFDQALRHDLGHDLVGVVGALATVIAQRERERVGEVARVRWSEPVGGSVTGGR